MAVAARRVKNCARLRLAAGALLAAMLAAGVLPLAGCTSFRSSNPQAADRPAPLPATITDASYDWHVLVLEPFGTLLKESPLPLHEVLLFHDANSRAESDNKDCYSIEGTPPRFMGEPPDHYLLCFDHDHLSRVDAAVRLPAAEAPQAFARACALWLKDTATTMGSGTACEGRDGRVAFSARLLLPPGDTAATVSMALTDSPPAEAAHDVPVGK